MSEAKQQQGTPMICATSVMRTGPTRIGHIGGFKFPRTIPWTHLVGLIVGGLIGAGLALTIGSSATSAIYGLIFGAFLGYILASYSPSQGESLVTWLAVKANATVRGRQINGERVTLAVGVAILPAPPRGCVRLQRGAVPIPVGQYDERGVLISPRNRNVPDSGTADPVLFAALNLSSERGGELTPVDGIALTSSSSRAPRTSHRPKHPATTAPSDDMVGKPRRLKD